jgi:hypothetical protein
MHLGARIGITAVLHTWGIGDDAPSAYQAAESPPMSGEAAVAQPRPGSRPTVRLANNLIQEATANTSDELASQSP